MPRVRSTNESWLKIQAQRGSRDDDFRLNLRKPKDLSLNKPVMFVEVVIGSQGGSPTQRLSRATPWDLSYSAPPGRYACYPAWDWKEKLLPQEEEMVTLPRRLAQQVLDAFRSRIIHDEVEEELKKILHRK